jgi:hypothetical protein
MTNRAVELSEHLVQSCRWLHRSFGYSVCDARLGPYNKGGPSKRILGGGALCAHLLFDTVGDGF